ncbi:hypothetical protein VNO78_31108 [Psophocarpus tetragonolobus]|uniref:Uncharacterized protein n=1 Tax=Psophocarpus tetragonolobus TaxID=3891 RepID=A0AAN9RYM6_PSOTE
MNTASSWTNCSLLLGKPIKDSPESRGINPSLPHNPNSDRFKTAKPSKARTKNSKPQNRQHKQIPNVGTGKSHVKNRHVADGREQHKRRVLIQCSKFEDRIERRVHVVNGRSSVVLIKFWNEGTRGVVSQEIETRWL